MKKIIISLCLIMIVLLTGCDVGTDNLQCTSTTTANGLTTNITYNIKYQDEEVKHVMITYNYKQDEYTTEDEIDGTNTGTDGTTEDDDVNEEDGIVDGVVGDTLDDIVGTVTDTILDIAGIKTTYNNQMSAYDDIEGFSYKIEKDTDDEYTVIYNIDFDKIEDTDLARFNIDRDFTDTRTIYEDLGYICK